MGAKLVDEPDRVRRTAFLKVDDRRLLETTFEIADRKPGADRLIILCLNADEDRQLVADALAESGAVNQVVDREISRALDCRVHQRLQF